MSQACVASPLLALVLAASARAAPAQWRRCGPSGFSMSPPRRSARTLVTWWRPGASRRSRPRCRPGATVIDLGKLTVLPGFIDGHTHVLIQGDATAEDYDAQLLKESLAYRALRATRALRIALGHGFTTLRDIGNEGAGFVDVDLKRAVEAGMPSRARACSWPRRPWRPRAPTASPATPGS